VDNLQFQFGLALKPKSSGALADLKSKAEKFFVTKIKGFAPDKMVACTLVFEGTRSEVEQQKRDVYRIGARHCGVLRNIRPVEQRSGSLRQCETPADGRIQTARSARQTVPFVAHHADLSD